MGAAVLDGWEGRLALSVLAAEHWMPPARVSMDPEKPEVLRSFAEGPVQEESPRRPRKGTQQSELSLGSATNDRGRFQDVAPTLHDGTDLDVPTYLRRGVRISS